MSNTPPAEELRRQAEERLAAGENRITTLERADLESLAHELAVHQMELEIQNDELRRAHLEAQEARDRYLDLYDFAPVGYFTLDEHNRIVEINLTGCRLLRADRQGLLDTPFTKFLVPEETEKFYSHRQKALASGVQQACELKIRVPDGAAFDARLESIRAGRERLRVALTDVTERKRADDALRASEDRYRAFFESSIDAVLITAPDGSIEAANAEACRMFGKTEEEIVCGGREGVVDTSDPRLVRAMEERARTGKFKGELSLRRKDGTLFPGEISTALFTDRQGHVKTAMIIRDITERKRAEEALREWNATLENRVAQRTVELEHRARQLQKMTLEVSLTEDRERKRMAEILHDDLQQIIAGAKFHLDLLRNRVKHEASLQALAAQIGQMLKEAIEKSRGLSHELSPAVLHQGGFVETLRWLAKQMEAKHGLVVSVHASGPGDLRSDATRGFLYRAAQELLFNVAKHARVKEARIRFRRRGQCVCLSVSDRGRGFDPQELPETAGYGLLSIRERVELLGGRMRIKSAVGKGSTLYLVVPDGETHGVSSEVETKSNGQAMDAGGSAQENNGRLRVLLADDHRIVREGLRSLLSEEPGVEIVGEAAHGREAVDLALRLEPDVVIMDVSMPLIDGEAATRQIKAHLPQTRVIALSTYNEPEMIQKMYRAGAEGYLLKAASSEELLAAIRRSSTCQSCADR